MQLSVNTSIIFHAERGIPLYLAKNFDKTTSSIYEYSSFVYYFEQKRIFVLYLYRNTTTI